MKLTNIKEQLIRDEGDIPYAYRDSLGYWTIGVGFLIDKEKGGRLPDAVRDFWLEYEINDKERQLRARLPIFEDLNKARQDALINMSFNLGVNGLLGFKNTLSLLSAGKYKEAAKEMLNSKWADQVGDRAKRLSKQIETGEYA